MTPLEELNNEESRWMKINDKWHLTSNSLQWILESRIEAFSNIHKKVVVEKKKTYHHDLKSVAFRVSNEDLRQCASLEEIVVKLDENALLLAKQLEELHG